MTSPFADRARFRARRAILVVGGIAMAAATTGTAAHAQVAGARSAAPALAEQVRRIVGGAPDARMPGCAAGIFENGKPLVETAAGYGDIAAGTPLSPSSQFYAASLSKQFTALAAIRLAEQGLLDLDRDIRTYLPELPDYGTPITARMLMHHSSGLRDWLQLANMSDLSVAGLDKAGALALVFRQQATNFVPGTRYLYSNSGYLLLAETIERIAREPFARHVERTLLRPLGMTGSYFLAGEPAASPALAHGYVERGEGFALRDNYPRISGSGGLVTTLADLGRFEAALAGDSPVLSPFARRLLVAPGMLAGQVPAVDGAKGLVYAAGVAVGRPDGRLVVRHGGSADGFTNLYVRYPEQRRAIVLLCNRGGIDLQPRADALDALVFAPDEEKAYALASGEQRLYRLPDLGRYYRVAAGEREIRVAIGTTADRFDGRERRYTLSDQGDYRAGQYAIRFTRGGRALVISSPRASGIRGEQIGD